MYYKPLRLFSFPHYKIFESYRQKSYKSKSIFTPARKASQSIYIYTNTLHFARIQRRLFSSLFVQLDL